MKYNFIEETEIEANNFEEAVTVKDLKPVTKADKLLAQLLDGKFKCRACNEKFTSTEAHVMKPTGNGGYFGLKDLTHAEYASEISKTGYADRLCFCGGHITIHGTGAESWETTCDECGFLWDED